jgi:type IX secretion system PorP/SprF family membrane protein
MKSRLFSLRHGFLPGLPLHGERWGKWYWAFFFIFLFLQSLHAQQEPQFTHYMFNTLVYNPGYAGSRGYLSAVAIYRDQWFVWGDKSGYDGRPVTQTFSLHSPLNKRVAVGLNIVNDRIGAHQTSLANAVYAYRIGFGKGTLSVGLQGGMMNWRADWDKLDFKDARELDSAFDGPNPSLWLPDFGAGLYYYTDHFYAGFSIPHLVHFDLRKLASEERTVIRKWAKTYRHFYFTGGGAIPLQGENLVFKPSILIKSVGFFNEFFKQGSLVREIGAPATFDLDLSLLFYQKLWLGAAFRSAFTAFTEKPGTVNSPNPKRSSYDSIDIWASFLMKNGLRLGLSYDYALGKINPYTYGTFEVMLGYDFNQRIDKVNSPRYF